MMLSLKTLRAAGIGFVIVAGVSMCTLRDRTIEKRGAEKVASAIAKDAEKTREKARKARSAARSVDDPVKRVFDAFCRNCN